MKQEILSFKTEQKDYKNSTQERGVKMKTLTDKEVLCELNKLGIYTFSGLKSGFKEYKLYYIFCKN